jgi:hypothetical protein
MVPLRNPMTNSVHNVYTPRIVPKIVRRETATGSTGTGSTTGTTGPTSSSGATGTSTTGSTPAASDPAADFKSLFGHVNTALLTPGPAAAPPKPAPPTLQSVFGSNPYITNPGGVAPNGVTYGYNPTYFATRATADKLAQMYGGTVVEMNAITPYGPFQQNQMNEMIKFPNGNVVNAGILASYYDRGWSQEQINSAINAEINAIPT